MSVVRKYHVKTRLSTLIRAPGGIHAGEAIRRSEAGLAEHHEGCLNQIDEDLARLDVLLATRGFDPEEMYAVASEIVALCAVFTDESLADAARSLCELIDRASDGGRLDHSSIQVHLASMRLLHRTGAGPEARAAILSGLAKVVEKQDR
jgi:hypothetical protein